MRKLTAIENVTLDGVMQAPRGAEEDTRGGFTRGGWAVPYDDEIKDQEMGKGMGITDLLFGRRTYEHFFDVWPNRDDGNPFTEVLNNAQKYVGSRTLTEPLPWENSTLLHGHVADAVRDLKATEGNDIGILGSGELVRALLPVGLIDEFILLIHPLVLGSGRKLFADDGQSIDFEPIQSVTTTKGVVIATYMTESAEPADGEEN